MKIRSQEKEFDDLEREESPREVKNKAELLELLDRMIKQELFCPSCGNAMFECSKCHKTLKKLMQPKASQESSSKEPEPDLLD